LLHESLFEKRNNHQPAAEREAAGFQKEGEELAEDRSGRRVCRADADRGKRAHKGRRLAATEQRAVIEDAEDAGADEEDATSASSQIVTPKHTAAIAHCSHEAFARTRARLGVPGIGSFTEAMTRKERLHV
jgi:hypothetical protein